jgi:endogenous inhibitor of DNA gyrase (YacG/DUF329 family)
MGLKVKSGMYCPTCQTPVAAQKSTHRLRNLGAAVTAPVTAGLSLAAAKAGDWHCPSCGGPVIPARAVERARAAVARQAQTPAAGSTGPRPAPPARQAVPPAAGSVDWSRFFE